VAQWLRRKTDRFELDIGNVVAEWLRRKTDRFEPVWFESGRG